jgi:hypothetical protein
VLVALIFFAVALLLFLFMRPIVLWYYKINEKLKLQREQNALLRKVLLHLGDELPDVINIDEKHEKKPR